ncbi:STM4015 family protein [Nocardiopsis changdeensis]|uniref:STM4015 family protein n=1 Tax=Nocardiopsis changdeensis TaxID=2831969 RepID=A0ABX8BMT3_9ACTN|nr:MULTISPECIES: STM4015 family protein [Nocardiopsis]QUX23554.1 STM4015 family protein [Nocardiopsis changdeensis]QYX39498.1 STM4015 family protein [Nocardiopsis sp. MT53]
MPNSHHIEEFAGLPVAEFASWEGIRDDFDTAMRWAHNRGELHEELPPSYEPLFRALADPGSYAWRLRTVSPRYRRPFETLPEYLDRFTSLVPGKKLRALVVGNLVEDEDDMDAERVVGELVRRAGGWPEVRSLFFGEVLQQENEISWIDLCDLAPLVAAFPKLRRLVVRGGSRELGLRLPEHRWLRELTVESGGLRPEVVRDVCASDLPGLRSLELWLGDEDYGGGATPDDLAPLLSGGAFPKLEHLGLLNTRGADSWVAPLAGSEVLARVRSLGLDLGDLTDEGGRAIIEHAGAFAHLERLGLHHHFLSEDVQAGIRAALPGVDVNLSAPQEPEVYDHCDTTELHYYTVVSE